MPDLTTPPSAPSLPMISRVLLGPGPSMVHPRVLTAMSAPMVGHMDPSFLALMDDVQELLRYLFQTENELTIPISGTGGAAMEASMANTIQPGDAVLVCINGFFGTRLAEMARRYGGEVRTLQKPWGQVFDPAEIGAALNREPAKVVAIVHGETSTGAAQPLEGLADIVHAQGGLLVVDTVASLGGVPLSIDALGIDVCYSGSQKCLSVPPGLGPISLSPNAQEALGVRTTPVANWYLDLSLVQKYWSPQRVYHHTAPVSATYALYEGLRLVAEEGLSARWERHRSAAELLWDGLQALGMELWVPPEHRLLTLTTVRVPDEVDEAAVRSRLLREYDIEIAGGLGELAGKVWRIGLMGHSARTDNVLLLLAALQRVLVEAQ